MSIQRSNYRFVQGAGKEHSANVQAVRFGPWKIRTNVYDLILETEEGIAHYMFAATFAKYI